MRRAIGAILLLHGLAQAGPGSAVTRLPGPHREALFGLPIALTATLGTALWSIAALGLTAGGLGLLGARPLRTRWRHLAAGGSVASTVMIFLAWQPDSWIGLLLNVGVVGVAARAWRHVDQADATVPVGPGRRQRIGGWAAGLALLVLAVLIAARPWHMRWGTHPHELRLALPGDDPSPHDYLIQHTVGIDAPPEAVWPWLAQMGQDRGGFYSYDWLENLFGLRIRNADRIVPSWQERRVGDLVPAAPPNWLGGRFRESAGWRVELWQPGRAVVLRNWGAFVVLEDGSERSRLTVRISGAGSAPAPALAFTFLAFEPVHFIMERAMLLGIRDRAVRSR
jgi:hypothetical protein